MPTHSIPSILVRFLEYELRPDQIQDFKTKINKIVDGQVAEFHNHIADSEQTRLGYPYVQYRSIKTLMQNDRGDKRNFHLAGLFGVADGVEIILDLLNQIYQTGQPKSLYHFEVEEYQTSIMMTETPQKYKINHWLPLNTVFRKEENEKTDNYERWKSEMKMTERVGFLESIVAGHIKDFCSEIGFRIPERQLSVSLLDYRTLGKIKYPNNDHHEVRYEAFDVIYEANIQLPEYLGMGKGKSKGFGWQTKTEHHQLIDPQRLRDYQTQKQQKSWRRSG